MENITETAMRHTLCPFELSLDIALQCDLIICDYNYVFDPRISLKRFFQQKTREDCLLLVDEAHNLFDRAREMYSASINKKEILDMARQVKKDLPEVYKALRGISKSLVSLEKKTAEDRTEAGGISYHASRDFPDSLTDPVAAFINETEGWMLTRGDDEEDYTDALISLFLISCTLKISRNFIPPSTVP